MVNILYFKVVTYVGGKAWKKLLPVVHGPGLSNSPEEIITPDVVENPISIPLFCLTLIGLDVQSYTVNIYCVSFLLSMLLLYLPLTINIQYYLFYNKNFIYCIYFIITLLIIYSITYRYRFIICINCRI